MPKDFSSFKMVTVQALRDIALGEELLGRYGIRTNFMDGVELSKVDCFTTAGSVLGE